MPVKVQYLGEHRDVHWWFASGNREWQSKVEEKSATFRGYISGYMLPDTTGIFKEKVTEKLYYFKDS